MSLSIQSRGEAQTDQLALSNTQQISKSSRLAQTITWFRGEGLSEEDRTIRLVAAVALAVVASLTIVGIYWVYQGVVEWQRQDELAAAKAQAERDPTPSVPRPAPRAPVAETTVNRTKPKPRPSSAPMRVKRTEKPTRTETVRKVAEPKLIRPRITLSPPSSPVLPRRVESPALPPQTEEDLSSEEKREEVPVAKPVPASPERSDSPTPPPPPVEEESSTDEELERPVVIREEPQVEQTLVKPEKDEAPEAAVSTEPSPRADASGFPTPYESAKKLGIRDENEVAQTLLRMQNARKSAKGCVFPRKYDALKRSVGNSDQFRQLFNEAQLIVDHLAVQAFDGTRPRGNNYKMFVVPYLDMLIDHLHANKAFPEDIIQWADL